MFFAVQLERKTPIHELFGLGGALARVGSQPGLGPLQRSVRGPGGAAEDSVGVPVVPRRPGALPGRPHNRSGGSPVYRRIGKRTWSRCWSCWTGAIRSRNTASARIKVQNNNMHSRLVALPVRVRRRHPPTPLPLLVALPPSWRQELEQPPAAGQPS